LEVLELLMGEHRAARFIVKSKSNVSKEISLPASLEDKGFFRLNLYKLRKSLATGAN
jgi:L-lactate utilization protein LutB